MLSKEQVDLMLSMAKPETEQDKHLVECIRYDLYKMIEEYELHEKHFEDEIKKYKYFKTQPLINALNKNIEVLQKERGKLLEDLEKMRKERDKYRNKWGRVKNVIQKEGWQLKLLEKAYNLLEETDEAFERIKDERIMIAEVKEEIEAVMEGNK